MIDYTIEVRNKNGDRIGEFRNWFGLSYSKTLNRHGECSFLVPHNDEDLRNFSSLRTNEIFVYRGNKVVWAGELVLKEGDLRADSANMVRLTAYGFFEMLNHRITAPDQQYDTVDAGEIAWDLIDQSQQLTNGDYGITQGTIETTEDRIVGYANKNIMQAIIELSEMAGGFDFEITDSKVFNVYARAGSDQSKRHVFEYGVNIESASIRYDFVRPMNEVLMLGSGFGSAQVLGTYEDLTSQGIYKLRQAAVSYTDAEDEDVLNAKGQSTVYKNRQPELTVKFRQLPTTLPTFGTVILGDIVRLRIVDGIYNINNNFRIYSWNITLGENGDERVEYFVSNV